MGMSGFILRSVRNMEDAFFFSLSLFLSFKFVNNSAECLSFLNARVNFKLEKKGVPASTCLSAQVVKVC